MGNKSSGTTNYWQVTIISARISSPVQGLLNRFHNLNKDIKQALVSMALSSNNKILQQEILQHTNDKTATRTQPVKLAKDLIKLADTYNIPELQFSEQAAKRRYNYNSWIIKIRMSNSLHDKAAHHCQFCTTTMCWKQSPIFIDKRKSGPIFSECHFGPWGKRRRCSAPTWILMILTIFHHAFTSLQIKPDEIGTSFFKRFIFAKSAGKMQSTLILKKTWSTMP
jgi:hypothetical protein